MKTLIKILFITLLMFSNFNWLSYVTASSNTDINLKTWAPTKGIERTSNYLNWIKNSNTDFTVSNWGQKWIYNTMIKIARDLKNIFFIIAWLYFLIIVLKLLFSEKTEEEVGNFKNWIIWISVWIMIMQISYYFMNILFDKNIDSRLASNFIQIIVQPMLRLLETGASFLFLAVMIFAFFKLVTANWDEEQAKTWKMSVLYAFIWFIAIKISYKLVDSIYWKTNCVSNICSNKVANTNIEWFAKIVVDIINWMNWFVAIIVILMIIYAGFSVLVSGWDEEKLKNAKKSILYIVIWLGILAANYLILTFFILPETKII